jgi:hypothetical protein
MSESKEPEGTPVAQGSTAQQGTQTTPPPPTEESAGASGAAPPLADRIPDAPPAASGTTPPASGTTPPAPSAASAMEEKLTTAMQPIADAIKGARDAEQKALEAMDPAVKAMAAAVIAGGARGTIEQSVQQTLQPVSDAIREAQRVQTDALLAMRPAVEMQKGLAAMPQIVTALEGVVEAEKTLDKALSAVPGMKPAARDMQDLAANGAARDLTQGAASNGMLRDTDGVLYDPNSGTDGAFYEQLKGVPIDYLIATPLMSAARANLALGMIMTEFINEIGYAPDPRDPKKRITRLLEFELTRPVKDNMDQELKTQTITVKAPLLAVVPLPALLIDTVNVDLTVEISQATHQKTTHNVSNELTLGGRYKIVTAQFTGKYSLAQENTRDTNQTAKYNIRVAAKQQPLPEGMSKLMDVFASTIEPLESPTVQ